MATSQILSIYIVLRLVQFGIEWFLAGLNRSHYENEANRREAQKALGISDEEMAKTLSYSQDKARFGRISGIMNLIVTLSFLTLGGLGLVERFAGLMAASVGGGALVQGLFFFALLGVLSQIWGLPFSLYQTFVIEERHGFNRQTFAGFAKDLVKGLLVGVLLGGLILAGILAVMENLGTYWWVVAWIGMFAVSLLTAWLYPTFLAPLFNKFTPIADGELKDEIFALAKKVDFATDGIFVMDASTRSSHGNAYFTGVFGKKRIVLFDTLVKALNSSEVVAVLAHELGHFKLNHIRMGLLRSFLMLGLMFYLLSLALPLASFYEAFGLSGVSNYGALIVFSMWFGLLSFLIEPFGNYLSRRNEFAADAFALVHLEDHSLLGRALLKLRETSHAMPLSHPLFSAFYYSHPPLLERLAAMSYIKGKEA